MGSTTDHVSSDYVHLGNNFDVLSKHLASLEKPNDAKALEFNPADYKISEVSTSWYQSTPKWQDQKITSELLVVLSYYLMSANELTNAYSADPAENEKLKELLVKASVVKKWLEKVQGLKIAEYQKLDKKAEIARSEAKVQKASEIEKEAEKPLKEASLFKTILQTFPSRLMPPPAPSAKGLTGFKPKNPTVTAAKSEEVPDKESKPAKPNTENPRFQKMNGGVSATEIGIKHGKLNKTGVQLDLAQERSPSEKSIKIQSAMAPAPVPAPVAKEQPREKSKKEMSEKGRQAHEKFKNRESVTIDKKEAQKSFAEELRKSIILSSVDATRIDTQQEEARKQRRDSVAITAALSAAIAYRATEVEKETTEPMDIVQTVPPNASESSPISSSPKQTTSNFRASDKSFTVKPLDPEKAKVWEEEQKALRDASIKQNRLSRRYSVSGREQ